MAALEREDRRRVNRAVRRGEALDDPVDAAFAVRRARQEQTPSKWWLLAFQCVAFAVQLWFALARGDGRSTWSFGVFLAVTVLLVPWLIHGRRQAREAERRNLQVLEKRQ